MNKKLLSIVLPVRNEEESLGDAISEIKDVLKKNNLDAEIIVSDSSNDRSPEIAKENGAILVKHDKVGYGNAYIEGFKKVRGDYIFCADPDGSYEFKEIPRFIKELDNGYEMVIGNRFLGRIDPGAMPFSHRYIGNPLLSYLLRIFYGKSVRDTQCGMRAIKKEVLDKIELSTTGMEFASEMIVKALRTGLKIKELPISYKRRKGYSKLNTISDGWRHVKFLFLNINSFKDTRV
jgi:glycosyltransferase involved in cell wall biosynthesis